MEGILRRIPVVSFVRERLAQPDKEKREDREKLLLDIKKVSMQIAQAESRFQMASDEDLIDSCIYEMEALNAQYRYLLRKAKEEGISQEPFRAERASDCCLNAGTP